MPFCLLTCWPKVPGTRFTEKYLHARMSGGRSYGSPYSPYLPSRKSSAIAPIVPSLSPPHSPPRKVVTDFAAFGAPKNASVFATAVASTPFSLAGGKAAFGGMRSTSTSSMDDEEEEEEIDDGRQKVGLVEDSITLDQARRIAMQSAWRGMATGGL